MRMLSATTLMVLSLAHVEMVLKGMDSTAQVCKGDHGVSPFIWVYIYAFKVSAKLVVNPVNSHFIFHSWDDHIWITVRCSWAVCGPDICYSVLCDLSLSDISSRTLSLSSNKEKEKSSFEVLQPYYNQCNICVQKHLHNFLRSFPPPL